MMSPGKQEDVMGWSNVTCVPSNISVKKVIFFCSLFNNAVSSSDYFASNDGMINE
jgi:hypothetical protein